ncbi:thrombopoietin isoform X2 [Ctenopharyngodon idella]|uniref:thrombopoietin isoform X2 n=1 Tax=Ctenopharyngodon idella TaxID=7959 RepID=UPI002231457B|nr:thrombopoietin isoform X2 [Ctenopharyngodon idella]
MFRDEIKKTSQPGKEYLEEVRKCGGDAHYSECSGEAHISVGVFALFLQKRRSPMERNATEDLMLSQGMDLSRVLVVVFSMVASELSSVQTRPIDFVCDSEARRVMNKVKDLQEEMKVCSAVDALPSPIQLPCVGIHKPTWERKSVHEWRAEILLSLGTLAQDVRSARTQSQPGCRFNLLERLERSINNYLHVVRLLYIEGEQVVPQAERCLGQPSKDLGLVLKNFGRLLTGKLEWLIAEMEKGCHD